MEWLWLNVCGMGWVEKVSNCSCAEVWYPSLVPKVETFLGTHLPQKLDNLKKNLSGEDVMRIPLSIGLPEKLESMSSKF